MIYEVHVKHCHLLWVTSFIYEESHLGRRAILLQHASLPPEVVGFHGT